MAQDSQETTCSCDHCFEGWLSPRMKERLQYSAELRYELSNSLLRTQDAVPSDISSLIPIDYAHIDNAVHYLPPDVRANIGPSLPSQDVPTGDAVYRGYVAVFRAINDLCQSDDPAPEHKGFPSVAAVTAHLSKLRAALPKSEDAAHIAAYLDGGGKAEYALDCIVDRAREELSPLGRQYDAEKQYIDAVLDGEDNYAECANDLDFSRVRAKLGLPSQTLGTVPQGETDERDPLSDDEE